MTGVGLYRVGRHLSDVHVNTGGDVRGGGGGVRGGGCQGGGGQETHVSRNSTTILYNMVSRGGGGHFCSSNLGREKIRGGNIINGFHAGGGGLFIYR